MIDAKAVVADLDAFGALRGGEGSAEAPDSWLREALQGLPVRYGSGAGGSRWVLLPGITERTVVLGASLAQDAGLGSRLGVITGVETLKALAKRFGGQLPCSVQLLLWADAEKPHQPGSPALSSGVEGKPSAYLELRMAPATDLLTPEKPLGMAMAQGAEEGPHLSPRLTALGTEAIQELTGHHASLPQGPGNGVAVMAQDGVPAAVMYVQPFAASTGGGLPDAAKLQALQAAEAFGRWVEATVHLLAGDGVDLWALEHRVPHS